MKRYTALFLAVVLAMTAAGCIQLIDTGSGKDSSSAEQSKAESSAAESKAESMAESSAAESSAEQSAGNPEGSSQGTDNEMEATMQLLQGEWFDINGDTKMTLDGDQLTIRYFKDYTETFSVIAEKDGDYWFLKNKDGYDFGFISDIRLEKDGSLTAYEMILDADGHDYCFVREEELAAAREIVDLSKDMPKQIESDDIREFILTFSTKYGRSYGLDDKWGDASYRWSIEKQSDGSYVMDFSQGYDMYMGIQYQAVVSDEYVKGLAARLTELDLPAYNGYYQKNEVDLPGYYLYVKYESKEKLVVQADGNAADTCVFDLAAILEYAVPLLDIEE